MSQLELALNSERFISSPNRIILQEHGTYPAPDLDPIIVPNISKQPLRKEVSARRHLQSLVRLAQRPTTKCLL